MANHKSAIKRIRQSQKKNLRNKTAKSAMKTAVKKFEQSLNASNKDESLQLYRQAQKIIAKTAQKGIIPKNTGSRSISRLSKLLNKSA